MFPVLERAFPIWGTARAACEMNYPSLRRTILRFDCKNFALFLVMQ